MLPSEMSWWTSSSGWPASDQSRRRQRVESLAFAARAQHREERLTLEILHRDEVAALGLTEVIDVDDVRVLDERRDARFVEQHVDERFLARQVLVHELDDDQLFEARGSALDRQLHLRHAALADPCDQLVTAQLRRTLAGLPRSGHAEIVAQTGGAIRVGMTLTGTCERTRSSRSRPVWTVRGSVADFF
jgi:hypothetical protein